MLDYTCSNDNNSGYKIGFHYSPSVNFFSLDCGKIAAKAWIQISIRCDANMQYLSTVG